LSNGPGFGNVDEPVPGTGNVDEPVPVTGNVDEPVPGTGNVDEPGTGRMANIGEFEAARKKRGRPPGSNNKVGPESQQDPESQQKWSNLPPEEKFITPPPKNKNASWSSLSSKQQDDWNEYSGGLSNLKSDLTIKNYLPKKIKLKELPVIFRIGDPRTKTIKKVLMGVENSSGDHEIIQDILANRFEKENEINNLVKWNEKIEKAKGIDGTIESNENSKSQKDNLEKKLKRWNRILNSDDEEIFNDIKDGNRDEWNYDDYNEAAKIMYEIYKQVINNDFDTIEHEAIKTQSKENLKQDTEISNEDYFKRLDNIYKIIQMSINSYKMILDKDIEKNQKDKFDNAKSIKKLNDFYHNIPKKESYAVTKLKEKLLFKELNQINIKNLTVNERTEYFKKLLCNH
jgi:hypothetical protein